MLQFQLSRALLNAYSKSGQLLSKRRTKLSSETVKYVLCLRAWGVLPEAVEEEDIELIEISDDEDINDCMEKAIVVPGPTLAERRVEELLKKEETEKRRAIEAIGGVVAKEYWQEANKRLLNRRAEALKLAQLDALT
ncbi:hypothetical protein CJF30_00006573 [Rutstroemia sp. NJR-2017a BBW]|nr:hypothetical protein CJF30_00006573 [Rutstroemia sp. NJR-2017a BBW]